MATPSQNAGRRFFPLLALVVCLLPGLAVLGESAEETPATVEFELGSSVTGKCALKGPGANATDASSHDVTLSWLGRHALGPKGWYCGFGAQVDNYSFSGGPAWPQRLSLQARALVIECAEGRFAAGQATRASE